jgi:hypothetical protein
MAVLSAALSALLILPCAATILITGGSADLRRLLTRHGRRELRAERLLERSASRRPIRRYRRRITGRGPRGRADGADRTYRRLDRSLRSSDQSARLASLRPPAIEQIAFDLQRLDLQRRTGLVMSSEVYLAAVMIAYDTRLCLACQCLGIVEYLEKLEGVELDLERVRIEGLLEEAGLVLRHEAGPAA